MKKKFHLCWFTWQGARDWEDPGRGALEWTRPRSYLDMAKVLEERGLFDVIVLADSVAIKNTYQDSTDVYIRYGLEGMLHDPVPLIAMMARATRRIGFVATLNISVYPPALLARLFATMDHMTKGRIGWNIVTGADKGTAGNFGIDNRIDHDRRYDLGDEYIALCDKIWRSWDGDAIRMDEAAGQFADPRRLHPVEFDGTFFHSHGMPPVPASPQRRPVIMQAGGSDRGRQFAAQHAEIVITHQNTIEAMRNFYQDIKARVQRLGRDPASCKVFFTVKPFVGETAADARAAREAVYASPTATVEVGLAQWSARIGVDLATHDLDKPFQMRVGAPEPAGAGGPQPLHGHSQGLYNQHYSDDGRKLPTLREVALKEAVKETYVLEGDGKMVAEQMAHMMAEVGGDGLAIRGSLLPRNVVTFVDRVVPELRRLGVVRSGFRGSNFRENLLDL